MSACDYHPASDPIPFGDHLLDFRVLMDLCNLSEEPSDICVRDPLRWFVESEARHSAAALTS